MKTETTLCPDSPEEWAPGLPEGVDPEAPPEKPTRFCLRLNGCFVHPNLQGRLKQLPDGTNVIVLRGKFIPGRTIEDRARILEQIREYLQVPPTTPFTCQLAEQIAEAARGSSD